jgi:hypothetical protein
MSQEVVPILYRSDRNKHGAPENIDPPIDFTTPHERECTLGNDCHQPRAAAVLHADETRRSCSIQRWFVQHGFIQRAVRKP